eukprot:9480630-Pyramimonas_sp.AAC.1
MASYQSCASRRGMATFKLRLRATGRRRTLSMSRIGGQGAGSHRPAPDVFDEHVAARELYLEALVGA